MREVAILGAGELGGALAHVIARRQIAGVVRLVDEAGRVAEGKALDLSQAAPVEGFSTRIIGSTDVSTAAGATSIVVADAVGGSEWRGEEGLMQLRRVRQMAPRAVVVCAGALQQDLVDRGVRELGYPRTRLFGSAPEAFAAAARALVALELDASPREISLTVLGVPPAQLVIPWEEATVGGLALTRAVAEPVRRRLTARISTLWPPGPYALATAASIVLEGVFGRLRRLTVCLVAPDQTMGARWRTAALPVRLGASGVVEVLMPSLSVAEQVALDNAIQL